MCGTRESHCLVPHKRLQYDIPFITFAVRRALRRGTNMPQLCQAIPWIPRRTRRMHCVRNQPTSNDVQADRNRQRSHRNDLIATKCEIIFRAWKSVRFLRQPMFSIFPRCRSSRSASSFAAPKGRCLAINTFAGEFSRFQVNTIICGASKGGGRAAKVSAFRRKSDWIEVSC